jgi:hypothetical protein
MSRVHLVTLALLGGVAACAAPGPYPSLEPREVERRYAAGDPERVPEPAPDLPALGGSVAELLAEGRRGDTEFERALAAATPLVARAGASGSESWIAAQQALSRAEAARAPTVRALADLDAYAVEQARKGPLSPGDRERVASASAELQEMADRQHAALARLRASLS